MRAMDVKTVCLGMLSDGEASGYDLKKEFESTFGHFFAAGFGSIYPALAALAGDGLVDCREVPQEGKPDRKVYRITSAGMARLKESLKKPDPSHKLRSEFLATLWFAHLMEPEDIETVLSNRMADIDRYIVMFNEYDAGGMKDWTPGERFVCGFGKAVTETIRQYIEDNAHMLKARPTQKKTATG